MAITVRSHCRHAVLSPCAMTQNRIQSVDYLLPSSSRPLCLGHSSTKCPGHQQARQLIQSFPPVASHKICSGSYATNSEQRGFFQRVVRQWSREF
ncbi:hypothetical protein MN608_09888 [Microdochium nivale]|nr:hypothetical protein MN608_09888 [Microdochium nivale]